MPRLAQVVFPWDPHHTVTLTVRVEHHDGQRQGPERRLEEMIAGEMWLALRAVEMSAPRAE